MTAQEYFKQEGYGALSSAAKTMGFDATYVGLVVTHKRAPSPFFIQCLETYIKGVDTSDLLSSKPRRKAFGSVFIHRGKHQAMIGKKYIGRYPTEAEAWGAIYKINPISTWASK